MHHEQFLDVLSRLRGGEEVSVISANIQAAGFSNSTRSASFLPDQESVEFRLMIRQALLYPVGHLDNGLKVNLRLPNLPTSNAYSTINELGIVDAPVGADSRRPSVETYCDERLAQVNFRAWTSVAVENHVAARMVSHFLLVDHLILGLFDADGFLDDLLHQNSRFCSGFMLNALLSWASLGVLPSEPVPDSLTMQFFDAAVADFQNFSADPSFPSLAGCQLLSLTANFTGKGELGSRFLHRSIAMGREMALLVDHQSESGPWVSVEAQAVASQAAWGLFSFVTLHSFHCQSFNLDDLSPPTLPIPEPESESHTSESAHNVPTHLGHAFPYLCRLWLIVHDMAQQFYTVKGQRTDSKYKASVIEPLLQRLFDWGSSLSIELARGNRTSHGTMILHILYHASIMALLGPFVLRGTEAELNIPLANHYTASGVYHASANQLNRLSTVYQTHFFSAAPTVFFHTACLYVANAVLTPGFEHDEETCRYFFYRALEGYSRLYPAYPVTIAIIKGLMAMAIDRKLISSQSAYEFVNQIRRKGPSLGRPPAPEEPTETCFVVDLNLATSDYEAAHMDNVALRFDEMALFDEFTQGGGDWTE